jgi:hypothetical protein
MADTPDLDLSILIRVTRGEGLEQTLASLDVVPRTDRSRVQIVLADGSDDPAVKAQLQMFSGAGRYGAMTILAQTWPNAAAAWNAALRQARGVWVLRLDAGDELIVDPLPFLDRHPASTSVQFTAMHVSGKRTHRRRPRKLTERNCLRWLTAGNPITTGGTIIRRAFVTHPFDETLEHLHEWAYWLLNRGVFDRPAWERKVVLTRLRGEVGDLDHADAGAERARIAERMVNRLRFQLPRSQRNNLRLQLASGLRQQGRRAPMLRTLLRLPSDSALYVRSVLYLVLGRLASHR